ncbi:serine/threonine-protein kinase [Thalassoroseus pseudoceratinae]|uniref:serine/threonine-protein kinase n=1 Tax=Thalassoroseus pseudoceratinae TaxID=2713176 RepID=UPI00142100F9|nr:serine/threonine-protein kinase [Thalassoroseus pseudoceratinae]
MDDDRGSNQPEKPMQSPRVLYCAGCNERFRNLTKSSVCPRCGAAARTAPDMAFAETMVIRDLSSSFDQSSGLREEDENRTCQSTSDTDHNQHDDTDNAPAKKLPKSDDCHELDELIGQSLHVYEIQGLLGSGGMGRVYLAKHRDLHRQCALKILCPEAAEEDVDFTQRFMLEGRAAASLIHPNIVTVHAIGAVDGLNFLEMEFIPGQSLQRVLDDQGRLPPLRATVLMAHIAEGLAAAHRDGIVHRDLKPDNVLMTNRGMPKLADFGLAKRILSNDGIPAEQLAGTPYFMAPELFHGGPATVVSDVYALGVTYYLLLTGRLPFVAGSLNELMHLVDHEPIPTVRSDLPDIAMEMVECLSLLMEKSPTNRPRDAMEAALLFQAVCGQVRDIETLLNHAFVNRRDVTWKRNGMVYEVCIELPDSRKQTVHIENSQHKASQRLLLIYSLCCRADAAYYESALRLNGEMAHGGVAIREVDGEAMFCVVDTYPRGTVEPEDIRLSVLEVARRADAVEHLLTGNDVY